MGGETPGDVSSAAATCQSGWMLEIEAEGRCWVERCRSAVGDEGTELWIEPLRLRIIEAAAGRSWLPISEPILGARPSPRLSAVSKASYSTGVTATEGMSNFFA